MARTPDSLYPYLSSPDEVIRWGGACFVPYVLTLTRGRSARQHWVFSYARGEDGKVWYAHRTKNGAERMRRLAAADPAAFRAVSWHVAADARFAYHCGKRKRVRRAERLRAVDEEVSIFTDGEAIYDHMLRTVEADPGTFALIPLPLAEIARRHEQYNAYLSTQGLGVLPLECAARASRYAADATKLFRCSSQGAVEPVADAELDGCLHDEAGAVLAWLRTRAPAPAWAAPLANTTSPPK